MLVSVIIPTYNRFKPLLQAIGSVLSQTLKEIEVIVVNDGSTDPMYQTLEKRFESCKNVQIIHLKENGKIKFHTETPQGRTRMEGVSRATGQYLAFLDDDDTYSLPTKLHDQLHLLGKYIDQNMKLCCTRTNLTSDAEPGTLLEKDVRVLTYDSIALPHHAWTNWIANSSVVVDKALFVQCGGVINQVCEDYECWKRILKHTNCIYMMKRCVVYDNKHATGINYSYNVPHVQTNQFGRFRNIFWFMSTTLSLNQKLQIEYEVQRVQIPSELVNFVLYTDHKDLESKQKTIVSQNDPNGCTLMLTDRYLFVRDVSSVHAQLSLIFKKGVSTVLGTNCFIYQKNDKVMQAQSNVLWRFL